MENRFSEFAELLSVANKKVTKAQRIVVVDKKLREKSLLARIIDFFSVTKAERKLQSAQKELDSVTKSQEDYAVNWLIVEARNTLNRDSFSYQTHLQQEKKLIDVSNRLNQSERRYKKAKTALDALSSAISQCGSASTMEMVDFFTKNKAVSILSTIETSGASDAVKKAMIAIDDLRKSFPHEVESEDIDRPDDLLDLVVDLAFDPGFDVISLFNIGKLDEIKDQCRKVHEKIIPVFEKLRVLKKENADNYNQELAILREIEAPFILEASLKLPRDVKITLPQGFCRN